MKCQNQLWLTQNNMCFSRMIFWTFVGFMKALFFKCAVSRRFMFLVKDLRSLVCRELKLFGVAIFVINFDKLVLMATMSFLFAHCTGARAPMRSATSCSQNTKNTPVLFLTSVRKSVLFFSFLHKDLCQRSEIQTLGAFWKLWIIA